MSEFDPTALSEIADILDEAGFVARAKHARAALAEITRQNASLDDAEKLIRKNAETMNAQAKRIAELEAEKKRRLYNYRYRFCFLRSERDAALAAYPQRIAKQRAALKKLGQAKRERGKALVEERAKDDSKFPELCDIVHDELMCPALDGDCEHWEGCPRKDELRQKARQQLRQEGVL